MAKQTVRIDGQQASITFCGHETMSFAERMARMGMEQDALLTKYADDLAQALERIRQAGEREADDGK